MEDYLQDPASSVATVMLCTKMLDALKADGTVKDNPYYNRILPAYRVSWPTMHKKTMDRIESLPFVLKTYHCGDVVPWSKTIPKEAGFISYPPFFSGDYEAMFAKLDLLFDWDKPVYQEIGDGHIEEFLETLTNRPYWAFGANRQVDAYTHYLRGVTQTTNRGVPIFIYSSKAKTRIVVPKQETAPVPIHRLLPGETIGDHMQIIALGQGQFQALRSQYMNEFIKPGQASAAYGVVVDNRLIGVYAFSVAPQNGGLTHNSYIYMLSDFAVPNDRYPRLSKLVLYAALSYESKLIAERLARRRVRQLFTTAFSNNPVSMKYRGLFDVYSRIEQKTTQAISHDNQRYRINYIADMGKWNLNEGLQEWKRKHAKA